MNKIPVTINLGQKHILIVGGGTVGTAKYQRLRRLSDQIVVVAKDTELDGPEIHKRCFQASDLIHAGLVILATGDPGLDKEIAQQCRSQNIPVDLTSDAQASDYHLPAVIKRGELLITISTGGASPVYAKLLRQTIEDLLPDAIEDILERMNQLRLEYRRLLPDQTTRAEFYRQVLEQLITSNNQLTREQIEGMAKEYL